MDKTPTLNKQASPVLPSPHDILDRAVEAAQKQNEYIGTTMAKALASPMMMRSPALQNKIQEMMEHVIDPEMYTGIYDRLSDPLEQDQRFSPSVKKMTTPTLKKTQQIVDSDAVSSQEYVLPKSPTVARALDNDITDAAGDERAGVKAESPGARGSELVEDGMEALFKDSKDSLTQLQTTHPSGDSFQNLQLQRPGDTEVDMERSVQLLNLSLVEKEFPEDVKLDEKIDQIFHPKEARGCYDVRRCQKLRRQPAIRCTGCQRRQQVELQLFDFL